MFQITPLTQLAALGLPTIIIAYVCYIIIKVSSDPLKSIPGPAAARWTRLWYLRETAQSTIPRTQLDLHRQHGPVVRLAPDTYSIDDPEAAEIIYGRQTKFTKAAWYDGWKPPEKSQVPDIFTQRDPVQHTHGRKLFNRFYSMSNWAQMETCVDEATGLLIERFEEFANSGNAFDLAHWLLCYASDFVLLVSMNKRFGFLETGDDKGLFATTEGIQRFSTFGGFYPSAQQLFLKVISRLSRANPFAVPNKIIKEQIEHFQLKFAQDANIKGSTQQASPAISDISQIDLLNLFEQGMTLHYQDPIKYPLAMLRTLGLMNIVAGSDTTSYSLAATIHLLSTHPQCLETLLDEIRDARAMSSLDFSQRLPLKEAQKLTYLQATIKEATRLFPATTMIMPRVVPHGGATISTYFFPGGTTVGISPYVSNRNKSVFGSDAHKFRPERWLPNNGTRPPSSTSSKTLDEESDKERLRRMENYYLSFGMGSRTCIGKNIALLEMVKLIPDLLWTFEFEYEGGCDRDGGVDDDLDVGETIETEGVWFAKFTDLKYRVKRKKM